MLAYLWLLLPTLGQAIHRDPRAHVSRWNLTPLEVASSTASSAILAAPSASDAPCKRVYLAVQASNAPNDTSDDEPAQRVPAELAYECLNSIPFNQSAAAALLESMRPYLEWQTTTSYVKDPPEKYAENVQPPYDFWSAFEAVEANVAQGAYNSEYDFGWDLYQTTQQALDGHFAYIPDVVGKLFRFGRTTPLVSVSEDGKDLPLVYAYTDILDSYAGNSSFKPSHIVQIDGKDTTEFLLDWSQYGAHQDKDALWNDLFYSLAQISLGGYGTGTGSFTGGSRGRHVYPGPSTTLTYANGSNVIHQNFAKVLVNLSRIESGKDMYQKFLSPRPEDYQQILELSEAQNDEMVKNDRKLVRPPYVEVVHDPVPSQSQRLTQTLPAIGYPTPVVRQKLNMNGGYFLEGQEFGDVAVLTVADFVSVDTTAGHDFQKINSDFIAAALAANKTKLIIDVSANVGGMILQGYDLFKQLFPSIHPYGASRFRAHEALNELGEVFSAPFDHSVLGASVTFPWDYHTGLDSEDKKPSSWKQRYGPHPQGPGNDTFTSLIRWDLQDPKIRQNSGGIMVTGYGGLSNITHQPFKAQNIVLVTDGFCSSTCELLSEFLREEAGVKTIALGGRPSLRPMQSVGGTKGASALPWVALFSLVRSAVQLSKQISQQNLNSTALKEYSPLPLFRGTAAGVNARDGIRRNDDTQTPYQFLYEPADCKIFYTKQMVMDQSAVWKTVADTVWGEGNACVAGDGSFSGRQGNITAEIEGTRPKVWSVRPDFDIKEAWKGLKVETDSDWFGHGDCVMIR